MKVREVRDWLGIYFLCVTVAMGGYITIFAESFLFPMAKEEADSSLQIILPLLVGQLTVMFKAFGTAQAKGLDRFIDIPVWAVKAPPILILGLLAVGTVALVGSNHDNAAIHFAPSQFRSLLTLCVSLLNATTVFVVTKFFAEEAT